MGRGPADVVLFSLPMWLRMPARHVVSFGWTGIISLALHQRRRISFRSSAFAHHFFSLLRPLVAINTPCVREILFPRNFEARGCGSVVLDCSPGVLPGLCQRVTDGFMLLLAKTAYVSFLRGAKISSASEDKKQ